MKPADLYAQHEWALEVALGSASEMLRSWRAFGGIETLHASLAWLVTARTNLDACERLAGRASVNPEP
ncbi:MAG: hypothetical protein FJ399_00480 [Verrucomicrobia bacterium]|nr:hypothetical protein [Verrucomicrobiota bacterium]